MCKCNILQDNLALGVLNGHNCLVAGTYKYSLGEYMSVFKQVCYFLKFLKSLESRSDQPVSHLSVFFIDPISYLTGLTNWGSDPDWLKNLGPNSQSQSTEVLSSLEALYHHVPSIQFINLVQKLQVQAPLSN